MVYEAGKRHSKTTTPFIQDFFNVKEFTRATSAGTSLLSWVINSLIDAINEKEATVPKYLVVVLDRDLLMEVNHMEDNNAIPIIQQLTSWLVRQIHNTIRQKRLELFEKKPGALYDFTTKIIFVKMLCRIGKYSASLNSINQLCPHFNDALNDAAAKINQYVLTINSCGTYEHFDHRGLLSTRGKQDFWMELDELLQRFDLNKIKLLPNPKNPPRNGKKYSQQAPVRYNGVISGRHIDNNTYFKHGVPCQARVLDDSSKCRRLPSPHSHQMHL